MRPSSTARRVEAVRLVRYGKDRWTVHVIYDDRSSRESKRMTRGEAERLARYVARLKGRER